MSEIVNLKMADAALKAWLANGPGWKKWLSSNGLKNHRTDMRAAILAAIAADPERARLAAEQAAAAARGVDAAKGRDADNG